MKFLMQLKMASDCGITIPTTLCSNDPEEIRLFLLKRETEGVIYRPLCSEAQACSITYLDFLTNKTLQQLPGVFQQVVLTKYTLRVIWFGNCLMATKLQTMTCAPPVIESHALPDELAIKIRALRRELKIMSGTLNFAVTPHNQYIFLDVCEHAGFD